MKIVIKREERYVIEISGNKRWTWYQMLSLLLMLIPALGSKCWVVRTA